MSTTADHLSDPELRTPSGTSRRWSTARRTGPRRAHARRGRRARHRAFQSVTPARSPSSTPPGCTGDARARGDQRAGRPRRLLRRRCASPPTRPTRSAGRCSSSCRSAPPRSRPSCCSSSSSGRRSTTSAPSSCWRRRGLDFCRHYLRSARRYRPHLLSEPEEKILAEKSISSQSAWARLFGELVAALRVDLDDEELTLDVALSRLQTPDRDARRTAAEAVSAALEPGLRTRGVHLQHARPRQGGRGPAAHLPALAGQPQPRQRGLRRVGDGADRGRPRPLRHPPALVPAQGQAARRRPAGRLRPRGAGAARGRDLLLRARRASWCSTPTSRSRPRPAAVTRRFFDERWVDAPPRPHKRGGAFCAYTVPSVHPYVLLNFTARRRDVLTMAHELGHGLHAALAQPQGVFHQSTPLTLAETASVFGEALVFGRLLDASHRRRRSGSACWPSGSTARSPPCSARWR